MDMRHPLENKQAYQNSKQWDFNFILQDIRSMTMAYISFSIRLKCTTEISQGMLSHFS